MKNKITRFLSTANLTTLTIIDITCTFILIVGFMYAGYLILGKGEILFGILVTTIAVGALSISSTVGSVIFYRTMNNLRKGK